MKILCVILIGTLSALAQTPTLSKEETLTLENIQLRTLLVNQELQALQTKIDEARTDIEKAHPGFTLQQTPQGFQLVKTPEAPKVDPKASVKH